MLSLQRIPSLAWPHLTPQKAGNHPQLNQKENLPDSPLQQANVYFRKLESTDKWKIL